jgi:ABC-type dipeptide/oligopeptide/nickel transport system permease subunit
MSVSFVVGIALGLSAAWFRGVVDVVVSRVMDLIMAVPSLVLRSSWSRCWDRASPTRSSR